MHPAFSGGGISTPFDRPRSPSVQHVNSFYRCSCQTAVFLVFLPIFYDFPNNGNGKPLHILIAKKHRFIFGIETD